MYFCHIIVLKRLAVGGGAGGRRARGRERIEEKRRRGEVVSDGDERKMLSPS